MTTRDEMMQSSAESEIGRHAETLFQKLEQFQKNYPEKWSTVSDEIYHQCDMNSDDLLILLRAISEKIIAR